MKTRNELLQARAALIKNQRTILDKAKAANAELTEEETTEFERLDGEIKDLEVRVDNLEKQTGLEEELEARERSLNDPSQARYRPGASALGGMPSQKEVKDTRGFKSLGEFVAAVRFGDDTGRLAEIRNDLSMGVSESGGYAVPEQFRDELLKLTAEDAIVRPKATVIPAGDPPDSKVTIPAFEQGDAGAYGGVEVTWIGEGAAKPKTDAKLGEVTLEPFEVAAHMVATDKLLRNWGAADAFIRNLLTQAMISAEDNAFLLGTGTSKPTGVINAVGRIVVNREIADKISYLDIVQMLGNLLPASMEKALFVASQSTLVQLMTIKDPAGHYIFIQGDATRGIPSTLLGIPLRFTGKTKPLGMEGDLALVDLAYYLIKDGSGPFIAASEHVEFINNKTVIKCFWNVDGKPWVKNPLLLEDKVTKASPYVVLGIPKP